MIFRKLFLLLFVFFSLIQIQAQHLLTYTNEDKSSYIAVQQAAGQLKIYSADAPLQNPIPGLATNITFVDYTKDTIISQTIFEDEKYWYGSRINENQYNFELLGEERVGDYICKKYKIILFSNLLEFWVTEEFNFKATSNASFAALPGVLVKYSRNGKIISQLESVKKDKKMTNLFPVDFGTPTTYSAISQLVKEKLILTYHIFDSVQICFSSEFSTPESLELDSVYHFSNGTVVLKKMIFDTLPSHYKIFAELTEFSNGDAYDRTGSIFVIPMKKSCNFLQALQQGKEILPNITDRRGEIYQGFTLTDNYDPLIELVRFFTPFGVHHYNAYRSLKDQDWADAVYYKEDISELRSVLCGEVLIGAFIGNYDGGGHKLSLDIKAYPSDYEWKDDHHGGTWIMPLFNTCNVMEMSGQNYGKLFKTDSLIVTFEIPDNVENLTLRYITTGHGGWGTGDEFVPKTNYILIDDTLQFVYTPWCTNCGTFRHFNPASGNFWNGISSSDYSRSGWCPGTAAQPIYFDLSYLPAGQHTITIAIPQGDDIEGGFNAWSVSGVLIGKNR